MHNIAINLYQAIYRNNNNPLIQFWIVPNQGLNAFANLIDVFVANNLVQRKDAIKTNDSY